MTGTLCTYGIRVRGSTTLFNFSLFSFCFFIFYYYYFGGGPLYFQNAQKDDETQQAGEAGAVASAEGSSGELSTMDKMAKAMGWLGGFYSRRQVIMRASRNMYDTSPSPLLPRHHRHPPRPPYRCTLHRPTSISFSGRFHCHSFSLFFPFLSPSFPSTHTHKLTHTHTHTGTWNAQSRPAKTTYTRSASSQTRFNHGSLCSSCMYGFV